MHFLVATALCLSLVQHSTARIPHSFRQLAERDAAPEPEPEQGIFPWLSRMIKSSLQRRQDTCYQDEFYDFVSNSTFGETFCQAYMRYPNTTTTIEYTPAVTLRSIVTTLVYTDNQLVRTTPVTTVTTTITPGAVNRRDALPAPAERLIEEAFALFNRQNSPPSSSNAMSAAFSSACACQTYSGAIVTATYTNDPTVVTTLKGFKRTTTTVFTTRTAATITSTVTVTASEESTISSQAPPVGTAPASEAAGPSSEAVVPSSEAATEPSVVQSTELPNSEPPTAASSTADPTVPTAIPFTCPDDNNTIVSQMVANERFDYLVLCDFDLPLDPTFYSQLAYDTFAECAAACSMANANFDEAVCQAAVYFDSPNIDSNNCLLKSAANTTTPASGVDAAILQRIAVGMDDPAAGISTENLPFTGPTSSIPPAELSSQMSSMMNASSTSLSMITPGPAFIPSGRQVIDFTAFSTYISDGTTYSTGSRFSTYYTSNGSWYMSFYSSYTVAWASATTVVAYGAQQTAISNTNVTTGYQEGGLNGTYTTITNTSVTTYTYYTNQTVSNRTDTIVYSSFASGGSFLGDSTTFSSYVATQTINGGSAGGEFETADSGPLTVSVSTTVSASITTATSSASSGPIATPPPSPSNSVIINSFGTGGSFETGASGAITYTLPSGSASADSTSSSAAGNPPGTVIVNSSGFGSAFSTEDSGPLTGSSSTTTGNPSGTVIVNSSGFGSAFSTEDSGPLTESSSTTVTANAVTANSTGLGSAFSTGSGLANITNLGSVFSSGFGSAFSTEDSGPLTSSTISPPIATPPSSAISSSDESGESTGSFSGSGRPRSGTASPPASTETIPTLSSGPGYVPPTPTPSSESGAVSSGTLPPSSFLASSGTLPSSPSSQSESGATFSQPTGTSPPNVPTTSDTTDSYTGPPTDTRRGQQSTDSTTNIPDFPTSSFPGYVPPVSTSASSSGVPPSSSPSGTASPSSDIPSGTAPSSSVQISPSGTAPPSTVPSGTSFSGSESSPTTTESTDTDSAGPTTSGARTGFQSPPASSTSGIPELPSTWPGYVPPSPSPSPSTSESGPSSGVPSSGVPSSGVPSSGIPSSGVPSSAPSGTASSGFTTGPSSFLTAPPSETSSSTTTSDDDDGFFTNSLGSRLSRSRSVGSSTLSGTGDLPSGTAPLSSGTGDIPSGTAPFSTGTGPMTFPPSGTGSTTAPPSDISSSTTDDDGFFTNSLGSRLSRSRSVGSSTLSGTGDLPSGTAPLSSGTGDIPSGTAPFSSGTGITSIPASGTGPATAPPSGTGSSTTTDDEGDFTNSLGSRTRNPFPSSSTLSGTGDIPSGTAPANQTGTASTFSGTGSIETTSPPLSTGPLTTAPPLLPSSYVCPTNNLTQATTTVFTTVTLYGCYSQCLPNGGGYYPPNQNGGPQAFGSPP